MQHVAARLVLHIMLGGRLDAPFIFFFICWNNIIIALLVCYHFTALCTYNGDVSASAICLLSLEVLFILLLYKLAFIGFSCCFGGLSYSLHLSLLCCNILSAKDSEVVDWGHEHTLLWPLLFFQVSSDHRCCGQGPPVPKTRNNQSITQHRRLTGKQCVSVANACTVYNVRRVFLTCQVFVPPSVKKLSSDIVLKRN